VEPVDTVGEIFSGERTGDPVLVDLRGDEGRVAVEPAEAEHSTPRRMAHQNAEWVDGHRLVQIVAGVGSEERDLVGRPRRRNGGYRHAERVCDVFEVVVGEGVARQQASRGFGELTNSTAEGGHELCDRQLEVLDEERHLVPRAILGLAISALDAPLERGHLDRVDDDRRDAVGSHLAAHVAGTCHMADRLVLAKGDGEEPASGGGHVDGGGRLGELERVDLARALHPRVGAKGHGAELRGVSVRTAELGELGVSQPHAHALAVGSPELAPLDRPPVERPHPLPWPGPQKMDADRGRLDLRYRMRQHVGHRSHA
jgi:hypothetical protein